MYLSGAINETFVANPRPDLGFMAQPGNGQGRNAPLQFLNWAADNGCYALGDRFDAGDWLEWLASLRRYRERCLFAVAPDVVGDAEATAERSRQYLPTIRQLGFPAGWVSQDGCTSALVPWQDINCLFVGGTDAWKLSEPSYVLVAEARRRNIWTHMGRVNSLQRLKACRASLLDSADGTFVRFGPDRRLPEVMDWLDAVNAQTALEESA